MPYVITQIAQAVRNTERVNIYLNGKFWIGLGKNDLITLRLATGRELTELEKQEVESISSRGKLIGKALRFMQLRPRSSGEVKDYLVFRNKIEEEEAQSIIDYLQEKELLSDEKFAQWYIDYKFGSGIHGVNKIKTELYKKKVDTKVINTLLEKLNSNEEFKDEQLTKIEEFANKIKGTIKAKDAYDLRSKLINRLMSRGFKYDQIKIVMKKLV